MKWAGMVLQVAIFEVDLTFVLADHAGSKTRRAEGPKAFLQALGPESGSQKVMSGE